MALAVDITINESQYLHSNIYTKTL